MQQYTFIFIVMIKLFISGCKLREYKIYRSVNLTLFCYANVTRNKFLFLASFSNHTISYFYFRKI